MKLYTAVAISSILGASNLAHGQTIEGKVTNAQGTPVAGAVVVLEGTGKQTTTDRTGSFTLTSLPTGDGALHISAQGYAHLHSDVQVIEGGIVSDSFTLTPSPIEVIDIVSTPLHLSVMESSVPVSVLAGETLRREQAATLGDTLEGVVGVHSSAHANVASTPVIRGLSGPRVLIAQNGLDVGDVSRVGPDHAVGSEASTAEKIEVLRGPATLFYGSGAIGGVVNVVDNRVPTDNTTRGEWRLETSTVDDKKLGAFNGTFGGNNFAFYVDGYMRETEDYEVPVAPELEGDDHDHEDEHEHGSDYIVENSAEESSGFTFGASYLLDDGFVGLSVEQFNREYGIPGHSHGEEEHDDHDEDHEDDHDEHEDEHEHDENVFADLEQTRIQGKGSLKLNSDVFNRVNFVIGHSDYEHSEIEGGVAGTTFETVSNEVKIDLFHNTFAGWDGAVSLHYKDNEFSAIGSEAFAPPSDTSMLALAVMEERRFGDVLIQLGARVEKVSLEADSVPFPEVELHHHDEDDHDHDEHDDDHDEEHDDDHDDDHDHDEYTELLAADYDFTPVSFSAGLVWDFTEGYNLGVSVSRSERAPSAAELLSFGPHIGTRTYEVGAVFELHDDEDHAEFESHLDGISEEVSQNIDLTLRKTQGDFGFILNAFYNRVDDYYFQEFSGYYVEAAHDHGHEEEGHDDHDEGEEHDEHVDELPLYVFTTEDVVLHGFEVQAALQHNANFKTTVFGDYVKARLRDGGNLPRTSPMRFGATFSYQAEQLSAHLDVTRYAEQNDVAERETSTDGYTLVDVSVNYDFDVQGYPMSVYFRGNNLTDTEARVHTSFLKDIAPRPGRNLSFGVTGYF